MRSDLLEREATIDLVKWEYLDASMGILRKQEEYNRELATCDMVFVVFWQRFGEFTDEEFQTALNGLRDDRLPRSVIVMFKKDDKPMEESLADFKNNLKPEEGLTILEFSSEEEFRNQIKTQVLSYAEKF